MKPSTSSGRTDLYGFSIWAQTAKHHKSKPTNNLRTRQTETRHEAATIQRMTSLAPLSPQPPPHTEPQTWDIFCKVIDNFGDIGVCWRLATQLAQRGQRVRLWVDDAQALDWMAPPCPAASPEYVSGHSASLDDAGRAAADTQRVANQSVQVHIWDADAPKRWLAMLQGGAASDIWVEGFGCDITEFIAAYNHMALTLGKFSLKTVVNLEYLSAEGFVARTHGLESPIKLQFAPHGSVRKWFFYPGFTADTGGLLRETGLIERQAAFDRAQWLAMHNIAWQGERLVSLFCYDNAALPGLLTQLMEGTERTTLLVTQGKAAAAVRSLLETVNFEFLSPMSASYGHSMLSIVYLPLLNQTDFDHLLWACDLNFVRGEDSLVRALWAGKPFVWQIYPQDDGAHHAKLQAFLDWLSPPAAWRAAFLAWNQRPNGAGEQAVEPWACGDGSDSILAAWQGSDLSAWQSSALSARGRLLAQDDLCSQLLAFVAEKRLKS